MRGWDILEGTRIVLAIGLFVVDGLDVSIIDTIILEGAVGDVC
jgi:hypothetical protein